MPYTSREDGPALTPEERDVRTALAAYGTAGASCCDWCPTAALRQAYHDWHARTYWRGESDVPPRLTVRQFGRAVRRVFPGVQRRKRAYGKRQWGYAGLTGPMSVVTPPSRRPR